MLKKSTVIFFLFWFYGCAFAGVEFWSANNVQMPINDKVKLSIIPELRFKSDSQGLYYIQNYIGPAVTISKNIELDLFYALKYSKSNGSWSTYNLMCFDTIYKIDLISNRFRFEYDISPDTLKFRDQLQIKKMGWSAAGEAFYNFKKCLFDEGRASISYSINITRGTDLALGYLLRMQRQKANGDWTWTDVYAAGVKVSY